MNITARATAEGTSACGSDAPHEVLMGHYLDRVAELETSLEYLDRQRQQLADLRSSGARRDVWQCFDALDDMEPPRRPRPLLTPAVPDHDGVLPTLYERLAAHEHDDGRHSDDVGVAAANAGSPHTEKVEMANPQARGRTHTLKTRRNSMDAAIDKAEAMAADKNDPHDVWNCLLRLAMAEHPMPPLLAVLPGRVRHTDGELLKRNFMKRMKKRALKRL